MKKMKNDNKGFTLVELIVVLVILAILAAILVPALLGYIDDARNKQLQLHGKSVYTAAQAAASQMYGSNKEIQGADLKAFQNKVQSLSEIKTMSDAKGSDGKLSAKAWIVFKSNKKTDGKLYYTVDDIIYTEDGITCVRLKGKGGTSGESWEYSTSLETADNSILVDAVTDYTAAN